MSSPGRRSSCVFSDAVNQLFSRNLRRADLKAWVSEHFSSPRTNNQLVAFLSKYRNMNFIKSHGRDNAR